MLLYMFIFSLLGTQLFSNKQFFCDQSGNPQAVAMCPPGVPLLACPALPHCYAPCTQEQAGTWIMYANGMFGGPVDATVSNGYPEQDGTRYLLGGLCRAYPQLADHLAGGSPQPALAVGSTAVHTANATFLVDLGIAFLPQARPSRQGTAGPARRAPPGAAHAIRRARRTAAGCPPALLTGAAAAHGARACRRTSRT